MSLKRRLKELLLKRKTKSSFQQQYQFLEELGGKTTQRFELNKKNWYPCYGDDTANTGFDRHYVYHPAWAARIVKKINPAKHIDISSSLHFCSVLSAFIPVDFYDYRPALLELDSLKSDSADLLNLHFESDSVESLSCMHTVEHIGLGRYGDPIDYDGDLKAINELKRVVAPGGSLIFVVPLGAEDRIHFNAHRVYSKPQVLRLFSDMEMEEFALIPEDEADGGLIINPSETLLSRQSYGCGCFWFKKPVS